MMIEFLRWYIVFVSIAAAVCGCYLVKLREIIFSALCYFAAVLLVYTAFWVIP